MCGASGRRPRKAGDVGHSRGVDAGVNGAGRRAVIIVLISIAIDVIGGLGFAGRFKRRVGDNIFGFGLVALDVLEIKRSELEGKKNHACVFVFDLVTEDELGHAMESELDGVGILEGRQSYFATTIVGNISAVGKCYWTTTLMVVAE